MRGQLEAASSEVDRVRGQLSKLKDQMMTDLADEEAALEWRVEAEVCVCGEGPDCGTIKALADKLCYLPACLSPPLHQIKAVKEDAARREAALQAALDEARALAAGAAGGGNGGR